MKRALPSVFQTYITTYKMGSVGPNTLEGQFLNNPPLLEVQGVGSHPTPLAVILRSSVGKCWVNFSREARKNFWGPPLL